MNGTQSQRKDSILVGSRLAPWGRQQHLRAYRRAQALGLTPYIEGAEVVPPRQLMTMEEFEAREPQPRPESSYTPTAWGSANADMDPERERFYAENPDGRR